VEIEIDPVPFAAPFVVVLEDVVVGLSLAIDPAGKAVEPF
jgi:hypothetical protein